MLETWIIPAAIFFIFVLPLFFLLKRRIQKSINGVPAHYPQLVEMILTVACTVIFVGYADKVSLAPGWFLFTVVTLTGLVELILLYAMTRLFSSRHSTIKSM